MRPLACGRHPGSAGGIKGEDKGYRQGAKGGRGIVVVINMYIYINIYIHI